MRKLAGEHPFCVLIYLNSFISHIYFILFIFLSKTYLIFGFKCLTLSLADTHGIAKYARTYIRNYTHTRTQKTSGKSRKKKGKKERGEKKRGVQKERKEKRKDNLKRAKNKGGKKGGN